MKRQALILSLFLGSGADGATLNSLKHHHKHKHHHKYHDDLSVGDIAGIPEIKVTK